MKVCSLEAQLEGASKYTFEIFLGPHMKKMFLLGYLSGGLDSVELFVMRSNSNTDEWN